MTRNYSTERSIEDGNEEEDKTIITRNYSTERSIEGCNEEEGRLDNNDKKLQQ